MEGTDGRQREPVIEGFTELVVIGRGGSSVVYSAHQVSQDRQVAIKVLTDLEESTQRLQRELRALDSLAEVPHVVLPYAVVTTSAGNPAVVMPLLGRSLAQRVREHGPQDPVDVSRWIDQLASCLDQIHQRGIVHRDIKPENVMFSLDESEPSTLGADVFLVDFGIAGIESVAARTATVMSISPPHAPPERLRGDESQPVAGDLYSLASTAYFALAGQAPFGTMSDGGASGLIERIMSAQLPRGVGVPAPVLDVLERAMSKEPAERYATARQFADALAAAVEVSGGLTVQRSSFTGPSKSPPPQLPDPPSAASSPPPPLIDAAPPIQPPHRGQPVPAGGPPPYGGAPPVTTSPELGAAVPAERDPGPVIAEQSGSSDAIEQSGRRSRRRLAGVGAVMVVLILVGAGWLVVVGVLDPTPTTTTSTTTVVVDLEQRDRAVAAIDATDPPLNAAGEAFSQLYAQGDVTYEMLGPLVFDEIVPSLGAAVDSLQQLDPPITDPAPADAVEAQIACLEAYISRFEREATRDFSLTQEENEAEQAEALAKARELCRHATNLRNGLQQAA